MILVYFILLAIGSIVQENSFNYLPRGPQGQIVEYEEFTTNYSEDHEQPYWVAYELTADELNVSRERKDYFATDPNITTLSADKADYKYSGYDRGHICRASFCKQTLESYKESFYFSNMSPQLPDINRIGKIWYRLENLEADFATALGKVYTTSGPVFNDNLGTIGANEVTIPGYFFKAILSANKSRAIGFLIKHEPSNEEVFDFAIPIDQLEAFTGIDFFPALDNAIEDRIEAQLDLDFWKAILTATPQEIASFQVEEQIPTFKIATFNIRVFGKTKAGKPEVMNTLAAIIKDYDLVAVQEFKDASGETPKTFLSKIKETAPNYEMLLSPRTGLHPSDKSSQEQYAYFYNTTTIEALDRGILFPDDKDLFQREPFLARFRARAGNFTFVVSTIHTRPEAAVEEIDALHDVVQWARTYYSNEDDFITLGDFNASCNYASPEELDELEIRGQDYIWIVSDDADTNVSEKSECAYDRIVISSNLQTSFSGDWGVDRAFSSPDVSDHFPVWVQFYVDER